MRRALSKSSVLFIVLAFALSLIYQNCAVLNRDDISASATEKSGGPPDGYEGKVYANRDTDQTCSSDSTAVKTQIEIRSGKVYLTRDDCKDVSARELSSDLISLKAYNKGNLIYSSRLFDEVASGISYLLCRGTSVDSGNQFDVVINQSATGWTGRMIIGTYDASGNLKSSDTDTLTVQRQSNGASGPELYNAVPTKSKSFTLLVTTPNGALRGTMTYSDPTAIATPPPLVTPPPSGVPGAALPSPGGLVNGIDIPCWKQ